jgi:hypothetical protein
MPAKAGIHLNGHRIILTIATFEKLDASFRWHDSKRH